MSKEKSAEPPILHSELMAFAHTFCPRLHDYQWWELAEALASSITTTTEICAAMASSIAEIKALWLSHLLVLEILHQRRAQWRLQQVLEGNSVGVGHMKELLALRQAMDAFKKAFYLRANTSPQAKYAEARLAGRRALMTNQHPMFDGFPRLVEILRKVCTGEVAAYITDEVQLSYDDFLDTAEILAREKKTNPFDVANPPARIRSALSRLQHRRERLDRERWMPPSEDQINGLEDLDNLESMAIAKIDWEYGTQALELPEAQRRAVEARIQGMDLRASDAAEYLGWEPDQLERTRRSLEADRRWGRELRMRFSAYNRKKNREKC